MGMGGQTDRESEVVLLTSESNYPLDSPRSPAACLGLLSGVWLVVVYGVIRLSLMTAQRKPGDQNGLIRINPGLD
jgi:hypothetical protein